MSQIQASINKILEQSGYLLLNVWSDTGEVVPNYSVDSSELNRTIASYQQQLDEMELEILKWLSQKKQVKVEPSYNNGGSNSSTTEHLQEAKLDDDLGFGDFLSESQMDFTF